MFFISLSPAPARVSLRIIVAKTLLGYFHINAFETAAKNSRYYFQDRCGVVNANGSSPLETMRGLEHYLNDIMRPPPDSADVKGQSPIF